MKRYLDHVEVSHINNATSLVAEYQGNVNQEILARSFELLGERFPILESRILQNESGYYFDVSHSGAREFSAETGDEDVMLQAACLPWDSSRSVCRLSLVSNDSAGFVVFRTDHSISDGAKKLAMFRKLWDIYTSLIDRGSIDDDTSSLFAVSPYEMLRRRHCEHKVSPSITGVPPKVAKIFDANVFRVVLDTDETRAVVSTARENSTSVHALVCGSILVAHRSGIESAVPLNMICHSAVDLRTHFRPPVGATEVTNMVGSHKGVVSVEPGDEPVEIGSEIKASLDAVASDLVVTDATATPAGVHAQVDMGVPVVGVSNSGVVPPFSQPQNGLRITGFRPGVGNRIPLRFPNYLVGTYAGRLSLECLYATRYFSDQEIRNLVLESATTLRRITS